MTSQSLKEFVAAVVGRNSFKNHSNRPAKLADFTFAEAKHTS